MSNTKISILANFAGRIWSTLLSILFVPLYLKYLSIEVYGIIGVFTTVQSILMLLDVGLSPTTTRELAKLSPYPEKFQEMRDFSRTLEIPFWILGIIVTVVSLILSPILARYWINSENLSVQTITHSLMIISVSFGFQWLSGFYSSGLIGLQKQVTINTINIIFGSLRAFGCLFVLAYISPTIEAFLLWQAFVWMLNLIVFLVVFWLSLPKSEAKAEFNPALLKKVWRYAVGMSGVAIVSVILTQIDKIVLSRMLNLEYFGYYTLASNLASGGIGMIVNSITSVYFPKFAQISAQNDNTALKGIYHQASQILNCLVIPVSLIMTFFSPLILQIWIHNKTVTENTWLVLSFLAIGSGLNGFMHIPYNMQIANGITKLSFWKNVVAVFIIVPMLIYATNHYGAVGAAAVWIILNLLYLLVEIPIMHSLLLKGEMKSWYVQDVGIPLLVGILISWIGYSFYFDFTSNITALIYLAVVFVFVFISVSLALPFVRNNIFHQLRRFQS